MIHLLDTWLEGETHTMKGCPCIWMHHLVFGAEPDGIFPTKLLKDRFKCAKKVKEDKLLGKGPERLFFERSSVSRNRMFPIFLGTFPVR